MAEKTDVLRRIYTNDKHAFINACNNKHLTVVDWLLSTTQISEEDKIKAFLNACKRDDLALLDILFKHDNTMYIKHSQKAFIDACDNKHLSVVDWLLSKTQISEEEKLKAFLNACKRDDLHLLDILFKHDNNIYINHSQEYFKTACRKNNTTLARQLYDNNKFFNSFFNDGSAFKNACENGSLYIAKILFEIEPKTALLHTKDIFHNILHNISILNNRNNHNRKKHYMFDTAIWLYEIDPTLQNEENDKLLRKLFDSELEAQKYGFGLDDGDY
jgi:hypothetical protein